MNQHSTVAKLLEHWSNSAVSVRPAATLEDVVAFEKRHGVRLPQELRDYFLAADGFDPPSDQDERGFSFWPLSRVSPVSTFEGGRWAKDAHGCFIFADYLSLSWAYAFQPRSFSEPVRFCIVGTADGAPIWIADGFQAFVEKYVRDDRTLYA